MNTYDDIQTKSLAPLLEAEEELLNALAESYEPRTEQITVEVKTTEEDKDKDKNNDTNKSVDTSTQAVLDELERLTIELSLAIEERKLNEYFDQQYRIYLVEQLSVSPLFADKIEPIIELVKRDSIQILSDNEIEANAVPNLDKLFMPQDKSDFIISIKSSTFVNSIIETYDSDRAIINQFLADFFRQVVSINNIVYQDIDDLFLELSCSNRKTMIRSKSGKPISTMMLLLLITCQSSHYLSYLYPHNAITEVREQAILNSEIKTDPNDRSMFNKPEFADPTANYFVMNTNEFNVTNIVVDQIDIRPEVGCVIESTYKVFDTHNCEKIYDIKAQTIFNERSDRCLIRYHVARASSD